MHGMSELDTGLRQVRIALSPGALHDAVAALSDKIHSSFPNHRWGGDGVDGSGARYWRVERPRRVKVMGSAWGASCMLKSEEGWAAESFRRARLSQASLFLHFFPSSPHQFRSLDFSFLTFHFSLLPSHFSPIVCHWMNG